MNAIYEALCAPFDQTYPLMKGGVELQYLTLEQVVTRLNTVLGPDGWDFAVLAQGQDETHCWAHGRLTAHFETRAVHREQMGECGIQRGMALGDSRKGAVSDALKKTASLIGVGLYLSHKAEVEQATRPEAAPVLSSPRAVPAQRNRSYSEIWQDMPAEEESEVGCADCGELLTPWRRKDGTTWSVMQVAEYARKKFGRAVCWSCGRRATG